MTDLDGTDWQTWAKLANDNLHEIAGHSMIIEYAIAAAQVQALLAIAAAIGGSRRSGTVIPPPVEGRVHPF